MGFILKKNISIIGVVGVPSSYGGFETLVENIIGDEYHNISVYCSAIHYPKSERKCLYKKAKLIYLPLKANGFSSILYDAISLFHAVFTRANVVLMLGVSGCIFLPLVRIFSSVKIITNIDGLEWRRDKWNWFAKRFLKFSEKMAVRFSDVIISDNQAIADYVVKEYGINSEVIAYGGDHALLNHNIGSDGGYALALCRIEPENNVVMILEAFSKSKFPLKFIGNWSNSHFGRSLKVKYSKFENIDIIDSVYDIKVLAKLRNECSFYVHGHSAGGTNPSLVEMMHFAKPIYCFDCSYNRATTENNGKYFSDVDSLYSLINETVLSEMGLNMQKIAKKRYTWEEVRKQYFNLF